MKKVILTVATALVVVLVASCDCKKANNAATENTEAVEKSCTADSAACCQGDSTKACCQGDSAKACCHGDSAAVAE